MKENLINIKTAKLAKEKGFNIETLHFYCENRTCNYIETPYKYSFEVNANQERLINGEIDNFGYGITWSAPTQSLLQKWLREVHNIFVYPVAIFPIGYETVSYYDVGFKGHHLMQRFESWEEAFEYALVYGLNKIENEK